MVFCLFLRLVWFERRGKGRESTPAVTSGSEANGLMFFISAFVI